MDDLTDDELAQFNAHADALAKFRETTTGQQVMSHLESGAKSVASVAYEIGGAALKAGGPILLKALESFAMSQLEAQFSKLGALR